MVHPYEIHGGSCPMHATMHPQGRTICFRTSHTLGWFFFCGRPHMEYIKAKPICNNRFPFSNQRCGGLDNGRISKHSHNWATRTFLPGFEMRPLSSSLSRCGMRPVKSPLRRLRFWFGLYIFHVGLPFWFWAKIKTKRNLHANMLHVQRSAIVKPCAPQ